MMGRTNFAHTCTYKYSLRDCKNLGMVHSLRYWGVVILVTQMLPGGTARSRCLVPYWFRVFRLFSPLVMFCALLFSARSHRTPFTISPSPHRAPMLRRLLLPLLSSLPRWRRPQCPNLRRLPWRWSLLPLPSLRLRLRLLLLPPPPPPPLLPWRRVWTTARPASLRRRR